MKRKFSWELAFLLPLVLMLMPCASSMAQYDVEMTSPDTTNVVSQSPSIRLVFSSKFDSSSIQWDRYIDSSSFVTDPTVLVIPDIYYNDPEIDAADYYWYSIGGTYSVPYDSVLVYSLSNMTYGATYVVIVQDVRVIDSLGGLHSIDPIVHSFTVSDALPYWKGSSLGAHREIFPDDTIRLDFSGKIDDVIMVNNKVSTYLGPIVDFEQHQSYNWDPINSVYTETRNHIESSSWLSPDGKTIYAVLDNVSGMLTDELMYIKVNGGYLVGDTLNYNMEDPFGIVKSYILNVSAMGMSQSYGLPSTLIAYPTSGGGTYRYGENVNIKACQNDGQYTFVRWDCPQIPSIHMSSDHELSFILDRASRVRGPIELKALYAVGSDSVAFYSNSEGLISLCVDRNPEVDSLASLTMQRIPGELYNVYASPDSGYVFDYWMSDDPDLDGSPSPAIAFDGADNISYLQAVYAPAQTYSDYTIETIYRVVKGSVPASDLWVSPSSLMSDPNPFNATCSLEILDTDSPFLITKEVVTRNGKVVSTRDWVNGSFSESAGNRAASQNYGTQVEYILRRPKYELVVNKNKPSGDQSYLRYANVYVEILDDNGSWVPASVKSKTNTSETYIIPRKTQVHVTVEDNDKHVTHFDEWDAAPCIYDVTMNEQWFVMDDNYTMTANYQTMFKLEAVYVKYRNDDNTVSALGGDEGEDIYPKVKGGIDPFTYDWTNQGCNIACNCPDIMSYASSETAEIRLVFSDDVDLGTLWGNGNDHPNIWIEETSFRTDMVSRYGIGGYKVKSQYFVANTSSLPSYNLKRVNARTNELIMVLTQDYNNSGFRFAIPFLNFNVVVNGGPEGLKSVTGDEVYTHQSMEDKIVMPLSTEGPDLKLELLNWKLTQNLDKNSGVSELYAPIMVYRSKEAGENMRIFHRNIDVHSDRFPPWDGFWGTNVGEIRVCNYWMVGYPQLNSYYIMNLKHDEWVNVALEVYEYDGTENWNTVIDALGIAVNAALVAVGVPVNVSSMIVENGVLIAKHINEQKGGDDYAGTVKTELYDKGDGYGIWWGAWPVVNLSNGTYDSWLKKHPVSNSALKVWYNAILK